MSTVNHEQIITDQAWILIPISWQYSYTSKPLHSAAIRFCYFMCKFIFRNLKHDKVIGFDFD